MMKTTPALGAFTLLLILLSAANAGATLINFETVPLSSPADQLSISNQYEPTYGVTFSLSNGDNPYLERKGDSDSGSGFSNDTLGLFDVAASGYEAMLGDFFLRIGTESLLSAPVPDLIIRYTNPVSAASAQIWDIDGYSGNTEQWRVQAFDSTHALLETIYSPLGATVDSGSLDGKPWSWSFNHAGADISVIEVAFTGNKTSGLGLAFDNFYHSSSDPVPEPATMLTLALGLIFLLASGHIKF